MHLSLDTVDEMRLRVLDAGGLKRQPSASFCIQTTNINQQCLEESWRLLVKGLQVKPESSTGVDQ